MTADGACDDAGRGIQVRRYVGTTSDWDRFVRSERGWTPWHLHAWRTVMWNALGHSSVYLAAYDGPTMVGILPLVRVRSALFGHFLVSVPFANYGGPLGSTAAVRALAHFAEQMAVDEHVAMLELRSRTELPLDMPVSHRKITVLMDMSGGSDALWKRLDSKLRSQVRRPQKDGITVRIGSDQVAPFFQVFSRHMRDLGTPTYPLRFFTSVAREFAADVHFAVAYLEDTPIACGCGFRWNDEFEITWASALREYNRMSPNMLVYWELMRTMADAGATTFNFGRCIPDSGTHRFKRQWGRDTRDEQLWWYERRTPGAAVPTEGGNTASLGASVWKRMPVALATALGPRIVRLLPV